MLNKIRYNVKLLCNFKSICNKIENHTVENNIQNQNISVNNRTIKKCNQMLKIKHDGDKSIKYVNTLVVETITDDLTYHIPNGWIDREYFIQDGYLRSIGYISYKPYSGQICSIEVDIKYRNKNIGKNMIIDVVRILNESDIDEIYAISTNNNFWKHIFDGSFYFNISRGCYCANVKKLMCKILLDN